jgi:hypothetical protein
MASQIEGGVSGVVNMRSARPFDTPGAHFTFQLQGNYGEVNEEFSPRAAMTGTWSNDNYGAWWAWRTSTTSRRPAASRPSAGPTQV